MYAERIILETNPAGELKEIPKLPPNKKLELIFLVMDDLASQPAKRAPHPDIAGKIKIKGDLFDTVPTKDWAPSLWLFSILMHGCGGLIKTAKWKASGSTALNKQMKLRYPQ